MKLKIYILILGIFLFTACFREVPEQSVPTPTKIISNATATALVLVDADCIAQESTQWIGSLMLTESGNLDYYESWLRNQSIRDNWLCDDEFLLDHIEYDIEFLYEGAHEESDFFGILDSIVTWLKQYPPDELPAMQPKVVITFHRTDVSLEELLANEFVWNFSYIDASDAHGFGLRELDLAEALGVAAP